MSQPTTATSTYPHLSTNADGVPVIAGTTMKVVELVTAHLAHGWSPEELHFQFPTFHSVRSIPPSPTIGTIKTSSTLTLTGALGMPGRPAAKPAPQR